jgi:hypothetical protein
MYVTLTTQISEWISATYFYGSCYYHEYNYLSIKDIRYVSNKVSLNPDGGNKSKNTTVQ